MEGTVLGGDNDPDRGGPAFGGDGGDEALAFGVAATCNPDGRASVKLIPLSEFPLFGFVSVNARVAVLLSAMVVNVAVAVPPPDAASELAGPPTV